MQASSLRMSAVLLIEDYCEVVECVLRPIALVGMSVCRSCNICGSMRTKA